MCKFSNSSGLFPIPTPGTECWNTQGKIVAKSPGDKIGAEAPGRSLKSVCCHTTCHTIPGIRQY